MNEQADQGVSITVPEYEHYKTKTPLILPFKGTRVVGNGGRNPETNNHIDPEGKISKDQQFAYDFVSESVKNEGKNLEDFDAFGAEVIAPGDGIISEVLKDRIDLAIGDADEVVKTGNYLVIDHRNGEWSLICHLKKDSIRLNIGDKVKQGDVLGKSGNSGNTTEPHIHYQLQDGPDMDTASGIPAQFRKIKVDGKVKENFEPERGQKVENI